MALIKRTAVRDNKFFDFRTRLRVHKGMQFCIYYGGRNIGKTTNIYRTLFQKQISQFNNGVEPHKIAPIGILIRSDKAWSRIKDGFLNNLRQPPFEIDFVVEGHSLWYVRRYEKTDKQGETVFKYKRLFRMASILTLWNANDYKNSSLEGFDMIVFDEIIPEHDGLIPLEIKKFETLYSTFSRLHNDKVIIGICNNIQDVSPYFDYIGISPDDFPVEGEERIDIKRKIVFEYCATSDYVYSLQAESSAGTVLQGTNYMAMAQGKKILKSENYLILSKPSGHYTPKYNVYIENVSYVVHQYSATAYWVEEGNYPYVKDYFLDKISAVRRGKPYEFVAPDWFANDMNVKMSKRRMWFQNYEIREIFLEWLRKNF